MRKFKRRWLIAIIAVAGLLLAGAVVWWAASSWQTTVTVNAGGGDAWVNDHGVGVRVDGGAAKTATHISFAHGPTQPKTPLDQVTDQIGEAIQIVPDQNIAGKSQVMFKVPASVPTNVDCSKTGDAAAGRPRSICNAGIEVYNTKLDGWVPLPTTIEHGNVLVADAPHYSEYRAVWAKVGDVTMATFHNAVAHFKNDTTPDAIIGRATFAFFQQLYNNAVGNFDEEKLAACEKSPNEDFSVSFQLANDKIKPCVVKRGDATKLLIGDENAIPVAVTTNLANGITPDHNNESELTVMLRDKIAERLSGKTGDKVLIVSGLDTNTFSIDPNGMSDKDGTIVNDIPLQSTNSWWAVGGDYLSAVFSLVFKSDRVMETADQLVDAADCIGNGITKVPSMAEGDIPGKLAEVVKACLVPAGIGAGMLEKLGVHEVAGMFLKLPKLLPESWQIGVNISTYKRTGHGLGDASFTVTNDMKALLGHWVNQCPGNDDALDILRQGDDSWVQTELGPDNGVVSRYATHFKVAKEDGKWYMEVEDTQQPGIKNGDKLPLTYTPPQNGYSAFIKVDGNDAWLFWNNNSGVSPC